MICLGIESTAHTFGVGICDDKGRILANKKSLFETKAGGLIPRKVADHHADVCDKMIKEALEEANTNLNKINKNASKTLEMKDIDVIAYSSSPGIGHMLRVGAMCARSLAIIYKKPLVEVNHCIAHLEIGRLLTNAKDPVFLYASGANTQIITFHNGKYIVVGETLDNGIGNFLDAFARELDLGFPGGPSIEKLAKEGKNYIELPYAVKGMDVSFGGILTKLKTLYKKNLHAKEDLCYSLQETAFAMLTEVVERCLAFSNKDEVLLGGGVACNKRLQEMIRIMCKERGAKAYFLDNQYNVDNGAMIAWTGVLVYKTGKTVEIKNAKIHPYLRTDDITISWRR